MKDVLLSEYKKRIEKIKLEEEFEKIKFDEYKELNKKVYIEYETKRDSSEKLEIDNQNKEKKLIEQNKQIMENKKLLEEQDKQIVEQENRFIELQERELKKYNYILKMSDGSIEVASKEDIEIATEEDLRECKDCEF